MNVADTWSSKEHTPKLCCHVNPYYGCKLCDWHICTTCTSKGNQRAFEELHLDHYKSLYLINKWTDSI